MAQWDVHATSAGFYALDIQSDLLGTAHTRIVIPLVRPEDMPAVRERLAPVIVVGDLTLHAYSLGITAVPTVALGPVVLSAEGARDDVTRALDMVLGGV